MNRALLEKIVIVVVIVLAGLSKASASDTMLSEQAERALDRIAVIDELATDALIEFDESIVLGGLSLPGSSLFYDEAYAKLWSLRLMKDAAWDEYESTLGTGVSLEMARVKAVFYHMQRRNISLLTTPPSLDSLWIVREQVKSELPTVMQDVKRVWAASIPVFLNRDIEADGRRSQLQSKSAKYGPSAGESGNLTGREFPKGMWAITYDDGPSRHTNAIFDELRSRGLKATFFWLSKNVPAYEKTAVATALHDGHELANHSHSHAQLTKLSGARLDAEILSSTKTLERYYGRSVGFFRLPYGAGVRVANIRQKIAAAGMTHVFWNVDSLDWQDQDANSIYRRTMKQVENQGRGVILFHDIHQRTISASAKVMDDLIKEGADVVTMGEALEAI
ncbi:MAG: polysaccharide deacetylase family protein, partial [Bdellovibrionales bacterium]|nr:polysaccharide deacetylase family protein [Bdellovibrionales bacterium]